MYLFNKGETYSILTYLQNFSVIQTMFLSMCMERLPTAKLLGQFTPCSEKKHHNNVLLSIYVLHPQLQALIYPLTVATKSQSVTRKDAAEMILKNMREHSSALVQQAIMVSEELIRVAILWHEQWHEGLEDASRYIIWMGVQMKVDSGC